MLVMIGNSICTIRPKALPRNAFQRLSTSVRDLVSATPISVNGMAIIGQMTTSITILDANTGKLVQTFSPSPLRFDGENAIVFGEAIKKLVEAGNSSQVAGELVYITRTDYAFMAYSKSRSVLWDLMYSDITAELSSGSGISCSRNFFSSQDTPGLEPRSCQRNIMVHRIRDPGHSDQLSLVGFVGHLPYSLPGPAENAGTQLSVPDHGHPIVHHGGIKEDMLALSSSENVSNAMTALVLPAGSVSINGNTYVGQRAWPSFILLGIFLLLTVGFGILLYATILWLPHQSSRRKT